MSQIATENCWKFETNAFVYTHLYVVEHTGPI